MYRILYTKQAKKDIEYLKAAKLDKKAKGLVELVRMNPFADPPPYESGKFHGTNRKILKRGAASIRKTGYEVMRSLKSHPPAEDNEVYLYIMKKESEGKAKKSAKIAGLNKFLRIYYARVKEVYTKE